MPSSQTTGQPQQQPQQQASLAAAAAVAVASEFVAPQPPPQPPPPAQPQPQQLTTTTTTAAAAATTKTTKSNSDGNPTATAAAAAAVVEHAHLRPHGPLSRPSVALSEEIMSLYQLINSKYSEERRRRQPGPKYNDGYDDRHGHYLVFTGEVIWGRYTVQGVLGRGSFGTVLKCFDEKHQEQVAAKVIRNGEYFYNQGLMEVDIVARLNSLPILENLVVRLGKVFVWKGHLVLVFEMLSMNLFQLIQRTNHNGVSLDLTRKFAYQLMLVLRQLEQHNPPIIHCDVKPENVVLRDPSRSSIRLIDFGSACYLHQGAKLYKYVQSRFYRSVEVILELGYDTAIDRWSLACMLVELHTGVPLFAGKNESDQLARFIGVLGPLPDDMIERSAKKDVFFLDSRQSQRGALPQQATGRGRSPVMTASTQQREHVASPSPVIAAEVLNSLSATSSISAVTAASTAPAWSYTDNAAAATTIFGAPPPQQQQQEQQALAAEAGGAATATAAEGRQGCRTSLSGGGGGGGNACATGASNNNSGGNPVAVPALRRPGTTTHAMSSSSPKRDGVGHTAMAGGGPLTPTAVRRCKHTTPRNPSQQKALLGATASTTVPVATFPTRTALGLRPATLTSRPRPTSMSHLAVHNSEGSLSAAAGGGRGGMQQTKAAAEQQQQQQQQQPQVSASPPKSPFVLRCPPTPEQCQSLEEIIGVYSGGPRGCRRGQAGHGVDDYKVFLDFVRRLLCYDPRKRMTCTEALEHPFLSELEAQKQWKYLSGRAP
ncbi:putative serine/threonine protein kinase [Trypanosoma conorhini]|uniref:Putative serine/threonine protein kinase n=1 Tax=Trypanosoma conorhini TaxID=83891 RepID=A0A3R7M349_9TRYP|nr:putative serine/threonine protein kinase [Trypanosoma conorhini]RNF25676.1 putative serine/threonine protein kinase [Trypanosoma conorhini]